MDELVTFNIQDGYAEALLRGLRRGILSDTNYISLRSCNSIKDIKAVFAGSDYEDFLKEFQDEDTTTLKKLLKEKLSFEVEYLQLVSGPELQKFIQIIRHRYMIDNIITIVDNSKSNTSVDVIKSRLEPLGYLPEIEGLVKICTGNTDMTEIYENVLMDTEVGCYFFSFLENEIKAAENKNSAIIKDVLKAFKPEEIKNYLKKLWLENFYLFCQGLKGTSRELMMDLLEFEADCQAIQVVYNSLNFNYSEQQEENRKKLIPFFGKLYPTVTNKLVKLTEFEQFKSELAVYPEYYNLVKDAPDPKKIEEFDLQSGLKTIDDYMFEEMMKRYSLAFEQQFHFACFYAYIRIKEQEIKNIIWLVELISLEKSKDSSNSKLKKNYILPFNY